MDYQNTNPKQPDEACMMDQDTYSSGDYPREVFVIGDWGDDLDHHDDDLETGSSSSDGR